MFILKNQVVKCASCGKKMNCRTVIAYNPRRQKAETQRVEQSLVLPRSVLFVSILKEGESDPVKWPDFLIYAA
jgi:hypothetical protein